MLAAAAVAGSRVDHELLAAVTGQDDGQLVPLLREAVARHLLAVDEASGGYVFRHALVQEAVYGELLPAQRGPLHAAYARALDRRIGHRGGRSGASGAPPSSWPSSPITGMPPVTRDRRCRPSCGPGRPRSWRRRLPRPSSTISARWSCGIRRPGRPPAARWTGLRCWTAPPRQRTWLAAGSWRWPWPPGRWARSTRPPSRCGPAYCWSGSAGTTGAPWTDPRRWPRSSGRWPRSPPTRQRGSGRACWPLMAACSCWWGAGRRRWPAARRRSPWPGRWARGPRRVTP